MFQDFLELKCDENSGRGHHQTPHGQVDDGTRQSIPRCTIHTQHATHDAYVSHDANRSTQNHKLDLVEMATEPIHVADDPHERHRAYSTLAPEQTKATREQPDRLLDRVAPFHQSKGHLNIYRRVPVRLYFRLYTADWFHSVLNTKTHRILLGLVAPNFTTYATFTAG